MSSSLRRGALAASVIAFSFASLAACGAGNDAQTLGIRPDNAATTVGDIKVQNAVVITQPDPEAEGPAAISATLFNNGDAAQTLDSIAVDGAGTAEIKPAEGDKLTIPAGGSVVIGGDGNAVATLSDGAALTDGNAQKVTFAFSETGDVSLRAYVVPAESFFASWGPTEAPSAPESGPSESGEPSEGASESVSATPTDEASASASATESGAAEH
ncbi:copper chaperone PCu(A)C [Streptomyces sp. NPDC096205]|uniref:copper chaperone PCu(A)C n=1 Tax=Streptomyces sp. NPDC096205 TaxID=3366081 RepID=UPI0038225959